MQLLSWDWDRKAKYFYISVRGITGSFDNEAIESARPRLGA